MKNIIDNLVKPDSKNKLGTLRVSSAIFGGLINAYLTIMIIGSFLNESIFENIVIAIIILPVAWSCFGLFIVMSNSKITALLKSIIPLIILYLTISMMGTA